MGGEQPEQQAITTLDGTFKIELPPGTYSLHLSQDKYQPAEVTDVLVATGEIVDASTVMAATSAVTSVDVVASVDVIYASEFLSTQQTAKPLADRLGLRVNLADPYDTVPFMKQVLGDHKGGIILVVTHADTISPLIRELHGSKNVPEIAPDEYDNLYIVTIPWFGKVKTLRLRYGIGWKPPGDLDSYTLR